MTTGVNRKVYSNTTNYCFSTQVMFNPVKFQIEDEFKPKIYLKRLSFCLQVKQQLCLTSPEQANFLIGKPI